MADFADIHWDLLALASHAETIQAIDMTFSNLEISRLVFSGSHIHQDKRSPISQCMISVSKALIQYTGEVHNPV